MKGYSIHLSYAGKQGSGYCLFPVPQTNIYHVIQKSQFNRIPVQTIADRWGNKEGLFTLNDVSFPISFSAQYIPTAIEKTINSQWRKDMYQNMRKLSLYLEPDRFNNGNDPQIRRISKSVVKNHTSLLAVTQKLYVYTLNTLSYGKQTKGLYSFKQALTEKITDCGGYSNLLLSLLKSAHIPCRIVVGHMLMPGKIKSILSQISNRIPQLASYPLFNLSFRSFYMHAWVEVLLPNDSWFPMDPSIEWQRSHGLTKAKGGFGTIPANRLVLSYGSDFTYTIEGNKYHVDLLQYPINI